MSVIDVKHLDDHRCCPHCCRDINQRGYVMSRVAKEAVLSPRFIYWVVLIAVAATYLSLSRA